MKTNQIKFKIKDFRAIRDADIILDGITIVSGENGSGKSTLSKFLYYVFKISNEYENLVEKSLYDKLKKITFFLEEFNDELRRLYYLSEYDKLRKEKYLYMSGLHFTDVINTTVR